MTNLTPFDLSRAKAAAPVRTRDGRKARIVCFDGMLPQPLVVLIQNHTETGEQTCRFSDSGSYYEKEQSVNDLFMDDPAVPEPSVGDVISQLLPFLNTLRGDNDARFMMDESARADMLLRQFADLIIKEARR